MQTREQLLEEAFAVAERIDPLPIDEPGAVVFELRALRLTLMAALQPPGFAELVVVATSGGFRIDWPSALDASGMPA